MFWDTRSSVPLGKNETHDGKSLCLAWFNNGTDDERIISGGSDCCIKSTKVVA